MALSGTTNKQSFTAAASQTDFVFTIPFFNATRASDSGTTLKFGDIKVTRQAASDGTITELTPADNPTTVNEFKVAATNGDPAKGGTVTIGAGATSTDLYVIERDVAYTQEYDLQEGSTIDPTALNKAFDRVVAQNQQQNDQFTRTVTFPSTDASTITYDVNESATVRANKFLGFNSDGDVTTLTAVSGTAAVDNSRGLQLVGGQIGLKNIGIIEAFIADDAVTYAKLQDVSTSNSVLGNTATGTVVERALVGDILLDQDTMTSDSAIKGATQQSIKAYVDAVVSNFAVDGSGTGSITGTGTVANCKKATIESIVIKTMTVNVTDLTPQTITFASAFPNNHFFSTAQPVSNTHGVSISSITTTGCVIDKNDSATGDQQYLLLAIGN